MLLILIILDPHDNLFRNLIDTTIRIFLLPFFSVANYEYFCIIYSFNPSNKCLYQLFEYHLGNLRYNLNPGIKSLCFSRS